MYCMFIHPINIAHRFRTGELLLESIYPHNNSVISVMMCDCYLQVDQLWYHGIEELESITDACIERVTTNSLGDYYSINISTCDGGKYSVRWYNSQNYNELRVVHCDTFIRKNTIVQIPHSLSEFFSIKPYHYYVTDHHKFKNEAVSSVGNGHKLIAYFKCKMLMVCVVLSRLNVIPELQSLIVLAACHSYKNHDYSHYLNL